MPDESPEAIALRTEFGRRVREHRERMAVSQEAFADIVGLDRTYVSSIERGRRNVSLENICRLASALKVDAGDLIRGLSMPARIR